MIWPLNPPSFWRTQPCNRAAPVVTFISYKGRALKSVIKNALHFLEASGFSFEKRELNNCGVFDASAARVAPSTDDQGSAMTIPAATFAQPADDAKETVIIKAAREAFLARGFDGASMDYIALRASVSKRTVYNRFRSKEALFAAAINASCREMVPKDVAEIAANLQPEAFIRRMSALIVRGIFAEEAIALRRIAAFEAGRNPEVGRSFLEFGPRYLVRACAPMVEEIMNAGHLAASDPIRAVWQLGFLITEPLHTELLFGDAPADLDAAIESQVDIGVTAFMKLYQPAH